MPFSPDTPVDNVVKRLRSEGLLRQIADRLSLSKQATQQWRRVPAERVHLVSEFTGIPLYELRPDLFRPDMFSRAVINGKKSIKRGGRIMKRRASA